MIWLGELRANSVAWRLARRLPQFLLAGWGGPGPYAFSPISNADAATEARSQAG
jgi:hypothetical protein